MWKTYICTHKPQRKKKRQPQKADITTNKGRKQQSKGCNRDYNRSPKSTKLKEWFI